MLFNSTLFLVFFAVVLVLYRSLPGPRAQNGMLLLASYVFYGAWDWRFLSLIAASTAVDFVVARRIEASGAAPARRGYLYASLCFNLGALGLFKYWNFGIDSLAALLSSLGFEPHLPALRLVVPVGISFYTFQTIGYTVDVYRGQREPCRDLLDFALYVAYFPQLVAGPIERSAHLLPQLEQKRTPTRDDYREGVMLILLGYFKKVVIADNLAPMVEFAFARPEQTGGVMSLAAAWAFTLQIYGDFAGYSLIARGTSRLMGIRLMQNFRAPYLAQDPSDVWRRWHISLSTWLRDYLYIGLGGNRRGRARVALNVILTMLLGGVWHGAGWNYVLWGAYWGVLGAAWNLWGGRRPASRGPAGFARVVVTFAIWTTGMTIFRCTDLSNLAAVFGNVFGNFTWSPGTGELLVSVAAAHGLLTAYHVWQERAGDEFVLLHASPWLRRTVYVALLAALFAVGFQPIPFIYFQF